MARQHAIASSRIDVHGLHGRGTSDARRTSATNMRRPTIRGIPLAPAIAVAIVAALLDSSARERAQDPPFRGRVDLVNIGVTVADTTRALVTNLTANDFAVYENGKRQTIFAFASGVQPGPTLHAGILLDVSASQEKDLPFTKNAVIAFLKSLDEAADVTFVDFSDDVRGSRFARSDRHQLFERVRGLTTRSSTSLYDAIGVYLDEASEQDGRKVMVFYTDGADTTSSLGLGSLMKLLKASDATVYAIGALDNQPASLQNGQRMILMQIAEATGGKAFFPAGIKDLDRIYAEVLGEVRAQYTIGYVSTDTKADGAWRNVEVKITRADGRNLRVRARKGYYASAAG